MALPVLTPEQPADALPKHEGRPVLAPAAKRWLVILLILVVAAWLTWRGLNPVHGAHPPLTSIP